MSSETPKKSTVYVDVDEEITSIVDKVQSATGNIVALVLPKRASVLQSSVNMKLLKRVAEQNDKQLVLITNESSLMPLAGMAGLYVASSLSSKPSLPLPPETATLPKDPVEIEPDTTVGDVMPGSDEPESIEIDNSSPESEGNKPSGTKSKSGKSKKGKLKVPNFNKFRVLLFGGIALLVLLIVGWYWAYFVAPRAVITIKGETSNVTVNFDMVADTSATTLDEETGVIPAKSQEIKKTETEKAPATGQKDKGNKASGSVSFTAKECAPNIDQPSDIPAGTGVSSGGLTFITQSKVTFSLSGASGSCVNYSGNSSSVVAQNPGEQYNLASGKTFSVSGRSSVTATNGSAFSGGTSQVVKVISASDVETAKQKLVAKQGGVQDELKKNLKDQGYVAISDTFSTGTPKTTVAPAVGAEASEVTVVSETTYTMLGVKEEDLKTLIKKSAGDQIDVEKQAILSYGIENASYKIGDKKATTTQINVQSDVIAGPEIDEITIKKDIAGKKRGEAEQSISSRPGIKEVRVDTKPFWIYSVPKEAKITIVIQEADGTPVNP